MVSELRSRAKTQRFLEVLSKIKGLLLHNQHFHGKKLPQSRFEPKTQREDSAESKTPKKILLPDSWDSVIQSTKSQESNQQPAGTQDSTYWLQTGFWKPKNNVVVSATIRPEVGGAPHNFAPRHPVRVFQWMDVRL